MRWCFRKKAKWNFRCWRIRTIWNEFRHVHKGLLTFTQKKNQLLVMLHATQNLKCIWRIDDMASTLCVCMNQSVFIFEEWFFSYYSPIYRYFYGPIDGTPFTLAIALPDKYGMYELSSQEEIRHSHQNGKCLLVCIECNATQFILLTFFCFPFSNRILERYKLASASRLVSFFFI